MTRSALDYKPRHKKPDGWAGSTPRGPHRWARAAANALTKPNSDAAKLYQKRVHIATLFRDQFAQSDGPVAFMKREWDWRSQSWLVSDKRHYVVCSLYCAAMCIQLDAGSREAVNIVSMFNQPGSPVKFLDITTLARDVRCQCCGSTIKAVK